jgi:hypothetical protein
MTQPEPQHKAADGALVEPGQAWAYRARQADDLVQVGVLRLGAQRPARVLVKFADEVFEGREEWVPPARLKALWRDVDQYRAREARWNRIRAAGVPSDDPREDAAETVIELLLADDGTEIGYHGSGSIRLRDPAALAAKLGLDPGQLTGHPLAFTENDVLIAPWEVTELIVTTVARHNPIPVLEHVAREEREARHEAIHGRWYPGGRHHDDFYVEPERCVESDNEYSRPRRELLRVWCGTDATDRFDELAELRKEVRRVGEIAQSAINALRAAGRQAEAAGLQRELGTPLDMLRSTDQSGGRQALKPRGMNLSNSDGPTSSGTR